LLPTPSRHPAGTARRLTSKESQACPNQDNRSQEATGISQHQRIHRLQPGYRLPPGIVSILYRKRHHVCVDAVSIIWMFDTSICLRNLFWQPKPRFTVGNALACQVILKLAVLALSASPFHRWSAFWS
jgi:hypothetical protein